MEVVAVVVVAAAVVAAVVVDFDNTLVLVATSVETGLNCGPKSRRAYIARDRPFAMVAACPVATAKRASEIKVATRWVRPSWDVDDDHDSE